jgi:hypothetical protein
MQSCRSRIERAILDDRGGKQRMQPLLTVYPHISDSNVSEETLAVLMPYGCLPSKP